MTPILGVIDSAKTGRLGPTITQWISNVIASGGNISITGQTNGYGSTKYIYAAGAGAGIGNVPSFWVQDTNGTYLQKRNFSGLTGWGINAFLGDTNGNIYANIQSGAGDPVVIKMNSTGTIQWQKNINGGNSGGMYISPDGTRIVARSTSVEADRWVLLDGSNGSIVYGRQCTSRGVQNAYLFRMSNTKVWTAGYERDGSNQGFVRQYTTSTGNQDWSVWYNDGQYSVATSVFYDSSGNVYTGGYHASDNYFVKMNSSGVLQWARSFGGGQGFPQQGDVDSLGNVYATHNTAGNVAYLVKFNSSGTVQWQRSITGSAGTGNTGGVVVLDDNNILVIGSASDGTNVNAFQMIVPADGSKTGTYTVGGKTMNYLASSLSISSKGGTMSGSQGASSTTFTNTDAGVGAVGTWANTTGLTNI
jgi:hypothetical protein